MAAVTRLFLAGTIGALFLCAAESPFAGTWKLNLNKSSFAGDTMTYAPGANGDMKYTAGGLSYTFKPDGTERAGLLGEMVAWKKIDNRTWEATHRTNGRVTGIETVKVAAGGATLEDTFKGTHPNGEPFEDKMVYKRLSGDNGLAGKWQSTKVQVAADTLELKDYGADGLTFYSPAEKFTVNAKFDGKEYPATGPTIPPGATGTLRKLNPTSFELVEIFKGKPFWKGTYTLSADKRTLTVDGSMVGANEPMKAVYDRQ